MGDNRAKSQEDVQDSGLCHWVILAPFTETATLTEKGLERTMNSALDKQFV